jgi:predicted nucleotidyltransferase
LEDLDKIKKLLKELVPYVIVVGSFAKGTNNSSSDIDLYVKRRCQEELDEDWYNELEEHYIDKVIDVFELNNITWDSLLIGYIHTNDLSIQIEVSSLFKISKYVEFKTINIFGVEMLSAIDNKDLKIEECYRG